MGDKECILCCEPREFYTLGKCNHSDVCLECSYKMRKKEKNIKCVICNEELIKVIVIDGGEYNY